LELLERSMVDVKEGRTQPAKPGLERIADELGLKLERKAQRWLEQVWDAVETPTSSTRCASSSPEATSSSSRSTTTSARSGSSGPARVSAPAS